MLRYCYGKNMLKFFVAEINELDARYTDGIWSKSFTPDEITELVRLYSEDLAEGSFRDRLDVYPSGHVMFMIVDPTDRYGRCCDYDLAIYPCMKRCVDYIKAKGYDVSTMDYSDHINVINITCYHTDEVDEYYDSLEEGEDPDFDYVNSLTTTEYYDADMVDEIVPYITSNEIYTYRWDGGKGTDGDYTVTLELLPDSELGSRFSGYIPSYCFIEGEVPDFVIKDMQ